MQPALAAESEPAVESEPEQAPALVPADCRATSGIAAGRAAASSDAGQDRAAGECRSTGGAPVAAAVAANARSPKTPRPTNDVTRPVVSVAMAPMPTEQPAADAKLPVPSAEDRRQSIKLIKELYKDDYAQAKQPEAKAALAEKLLNDAQQTKDDATALYCVLHEARDLAVEAANPALAERAISMLAGRFAIEPLQELAAALEEMAGKPHPADANRAIAEAALARVEEAQAASDFETAKRLADVARRRHGSRRTPACRSGPSRSAKLSRRRNNNGMPGRRPRPRSRRTPDDPAANLAVGRYLCFGLGDWEQGFVHLAKGPDGSLKDLAAKSLKGPSDAAALADLGDVWFAAAEKAKGKDKADLRAGAAYWYTLAEPGLNGLVKTVVEKRLKDLGGTVVVARSASAGKPSENLELPLAAGVTIKFRLIPAGKFVMGSPQMEPGRTNAELQHEVTISKPFYMGVYELTQAQWLAVTGKNPSRIQGDLARPVEKVSPSDVQEFLATLNQSSLASAYVFRLPTEAEWEYACRAGTTTAYSFGDDPGLLKDYAWYVDNAGGTTHPVGQLKPNPWGLYDMHGNVWEYCSDWTGGENYYLKSAPVDPKGPETGTSHVNRGGSQLMPVARVRSATRGGDEIRHGTYGFRLACEPIRGFKPALAAAPRAALPRPTTARSTAPAGLVSNRPLAFARPRSSGTWPNGHVARRQSQSGITGAPSPNPPEITDAAQLPAEPFTVFGIELSNSKTLTDKDLAQVAELMNLVELKLTGTAIGDEGMAHIGRLPNLRLLYLHNTKVTDAGLPALENLTSLTHLFLPGTKTTDAGFVHLHPLTAIRHLGLQGTGLTDAGVKNLAGMTHLSWLALSKM